MWPGRMPAMMLLSMVVCPLQRSFVSIQHSCFSSFTPLSCAPPRNALFSSKRPFFQTSSLLLHSLDEIPCFTLPKDGVLLEEEDERDLQLAVEDEETDWEVQKRITIKRFQLLSNKEKKELRAYAHGLGNRLVSQQVGKAGVTRSLSTAIRDALEANEIMKVRVLDNCPDELEEVIEKLEETTEAQIVGKIGNTLLLYRPSLRKLAAAERQNNDLRISQKGKSNKPARGKRKL